MPCEVAIRHRLLYANFSALERRGPSELPCVRSRCVKSGKSKAAQMWVLRNTRYIATYGSTSCSRSTADGSVAQRSRPSQYDWIYSTSNQTVVQRRPSLWWHDYPSGANVRRKRGTAGGGTRSSLHTGRTSSLSRSLKFDDTGCAFTEPAMPHSGGAGRQSARLVFEHG